SINCRLSFKPPPAAVFFSPLCPYPPLLDQCESQRNDRMDTYPEAEDDVERWTQWPSMA
ncbi:hypothetical protein L915_10490, partial [Phytophthora nicotianae]